MSEAEPELGLGVVVSAEGRQVVVRFPAVNETRVYARESAPLSRVRFDPGALVSVAPGRRLRVLETVEEGTLLRYRCEDASGAVEWVPESRIDARTRVDRPQDRLLAGRVDPDGWFDLRRRTRERMAAMRESPAFGLVGPRVRPVPHQLYIAHEVARRPVVRALLADEVGLGKTIEAGLILHRLLLSGRVRRVLVLVPEVLLHQWLVEMLRRFNLAFSLFDADRLRAEGGDDPFLGAQQVLCGIELLTASPHAARAALEGEWDLLVVDEAHRLRWSPQESSLEYDLVEALAERVPHVLLLTGTPEQAGEAGHFARLRLLDPERFCDHDAFVAAQRDHERVARLAGRLLDGEPPDAEDLRLLDETLGKIEGRSTEALVARLLDRHGTGRVLFRNTRASVGGFPDRVVHACALPASGEEAGGIEADPRARWLAERIESLAPEKVLVICERAETAIALRDRLFSSHGLRVAAFHEGMTLIERDRAAAWFAEADGCRALLCSEIGSEGRNFQFARHLVLFDLPLDVERLEQRIGRLDRIGQRGPVHLHVPWIEGSAGETLFRWYHEGLGVLERFRPAAGPVQALLGGRLRAALDDPARTEALLAEARAEMARVGRALEAGRDRLLELNSHRPEVSRDLVEAVRSQDADPELGRWLHDFWDAWGIEHAPARDGAEVIRPGAHMRQARVPGLPEEGLTVTWSREDALAHEDRTFLTWEHPLVRGAMEQLTGGDLGSAAVVLCRQTALPSGSVWLELLFVVECLAPADLGIDRYLTPAPLRLLLDEGGEDRAGAWAPGALRGKDLSGNRKLLSLLLRARAPLLRELFARGERMAAVRARTRAGQAAARLRDDLDAEIERLEALARVNPMVRECEIDLLRAHRDRALAHLREARPRLDAVRLVVSG